MKAEPIVATKLTEETRPEWNLAIDCTYHADPLLAKNNAGDVISKLFPVGNQGGFRYCGPRSSPELIILCTSGKDPLWRDELDIESGSFLYYGDNKKPLSKLSETKPGGNLVLENVFKMAFSDDPEVRKKIPPIFVFESAKGRDMTFRGLVAPGIKWRPKKDWLIAVWGCNAIGERFQNYKALFTVIDTSTGSLFSPDAAINLGWITDIKNGHAYDSKYAPLEWKSFIDGKNYRPLICKPISTVKTKEEQLPGDENGMQMLKVLHDYFIEEDNGYSFEGFACDLAKQMDDRIALLDVTSPYRDGGFDGVGKYRLFAKSENQVFADFYLQAKCYAANNPVGVDGTSRVISRIKNRQFGLLFTTSYVGKQAFQEILDDGHPVNIVSGKDIVDFLFDDLEIYTPEALEKWLERNYPHPAKKVRRSAILAEAIA